MGRTTIAVWPRSSGASPQKMPPQHMGQVGQPRRAVRLYFTADPVGPDRSRKPSALSASTHNGTGSSSSTRPALCLPDPRKSSAQEPDAANALVTVPTWRSPPARFEPANFKRWFGDWENDTQERNRGLDERSAGSDAGAVGPTEQSWRLDA